MAAGVEVEGAGLAHQLHAGFERGLVALAAVAGVAAGDQVFPGGGASAGARDHVVEREFARGQHGVAVLAGIAVAQQNVFAREGAALMRDAAVLEQPDHRGQAHGHAGGVQEVSVLFFGHGHALEHEHEGAAGGADIDGLVGGVEHKHRREQGMSVAGAVRRRRHEQAGG